MVSNIIKDLASRDRRPNLQATTCESMQDDLIRIAQDSSWQYVSEDIRIQAAKYLMGTISNDKKGLWNCLDQLAALPITDEHLDTVPADRELQQELREHGINIVFTLDKQGNPTEALFSSEALDSTDISLTVDFIRRNKQLLIDRSEIGSSFEELSPTNIDPTKVTKVLDQNLHLFGNPALLEVDQRLGLDHIDNEIIDLVMSLPESEKKSGYLKTILNTDTQLLVGMVLNTLGFCKDAPVTVATKLNKLLENLDETTRNNFIDQLTEGIMWRRNSNGNLLLNNKEMKSYKSLLTAGKNLPEIAKIIQNLIKKDRELRLNSPDRQPPLKQIFEKWLED